MIRNGGTSSCSAACMTCCLTTPRSGCGLTARFRGRSWRRRKGESYVEDLPFRTPNSALGRWPFASDRPRATEEPWSSTPSRTGDQRDVISEAHAATKDRRATAVGGASDPPVVVGWTGRKHATGDLSGSPVACTATLGLPESGGYYSGWRKREIFELRWREVDRAGRLSAGGPAEATAARLSSDGGPQSGPSRDPGARRDAADGAQVAGDL